MHTSLHSRLFAELSSVATGLGVSGCVAFAVAAMMGAVPHAAVAQDAAAESGQLEEVVVTAQKRLENAQKVPVTVTAVSAEQLLASGVVTTNSLSTVVSGLTIGTAVSGFQPRLRGVGTGFFGPGIENPVALYVDGVYYSSQLTAPTDLSGVSQIAVLKGPQGTLFGRNSTGGVIQMNTRDPQATLGGELRTELDNYETSRNFAYVTGAVTDTLNANLALQYAGQGQGWGTNFSNGDEIHRINGDFAARTKWFWSPSEATTLKLNLDYSKRNDTMGPNYRLYADPRVPGLFPGMGTTVSSTNLYDTTNFITDQNRLEQGGGSVTLDQDVGFARLVSISAYRKSHFFSYNDTFGSTPPVSYVYYKTNNEQFSQELQLLSKSEGRFKWVAGAYYFHSTDDLAPQQLGFFNASAALGGNALGNLAFLGGDVNTLDFALKLKTESLAAFGQGTLALTDTTRLTLGLRYTTEDRHIDETIDASVDGFAFPFTEQHDKFSEDKPTWRLSLDHDFADDVMGYASYNRGFKSGGFNAFYTAPPYQAEKADAFELGVKSELLDRTLRLNTAAFYTKYSNIQVLLVNNVSLEVKNAAAAKIYGLDIDAQWRATEALSFTAGLEWLHARFENFANLPYSLALPGGGLNNLGLPPRSGDGLSLPFAPDLTADIAANYTVQLSQGKLDFNITDAYNDGFYFEPDNFAQQDSFNLVNAAVTWTSADDHLSVGLFGRNLGDEHVPVFVAATAPTGFLADYSNPPRTYGVMAQYRFGGAR